MSFPQVEETFRFTIHVMAQRNDWYYDNLDVYGVHGLLCDNQEDSYSLGSIYFQTRFDILPAGAFATFENNNYNYAYYDYQDYVTGPAAKVTFGWPSSDVESIGVIATDEYGGETYGTVHSEPISNLDFSASDPNTVALTSYPDIYTYANHSAGLRSYWLNYQTGPISGGSTTKSVYWSYLAYAGPVNYSGTKTFPLLDYQYYSTDNPSNEEYFFVFSNTDGGPIPNAGSGRKEGTVTRIVVTSGQFDNSVEEFFT